MALQAGERKTCVCGAEIIGAAHSETGKVSPVTLEPKENGNVLIWRVETPEGPRGAEVQYAIPSRVIVGELRKLHVPLRLNHFADCPEAKRFSRSGRSPR